MAYHAEITNNMRMGVTLAEQIHLSVNKFQEIRHYSLNRHFSSVEPTSEE